MYQETRLVHEGEASMADRKVRVSETSPGAWVNSTCAGVNERLDQSQADRALKTYFYRHAIDPTLTNSMRNGRPSPFDNSRRPM